MRKLLFFVLAALAFASCTQDVVVEVTANKSDSVDTITVGFEGNENETRIQLNDQKQTVWTKDDLVSVFYRSNANQKWKYEGETGARTAELKRVNAGSATREMDRVVIVYPYNEDYYINPSTYNVQASLPAVQTYIDNSYGLNGNIMVSSSEYNQFSLKSVCGWLKLQLKGDGEVVKLITLRGNNGEQVAGELYINTSDATAVLASEMGSSEENNAGGSLVFEDTILSEVTLDCGEGVKLLPVATSFYIALPPCTFEKGFTVEITDDSDYTMVQSTSKEMIVERNHIQPMAAFTFVNPNVEGEPKPANNEIWYTATEKVEPYWDDANTYGVRLVTNTWDEATGKGIYTFAGDVTKVGAEAFLECKKLQSIVLPDSATEIGSNAFKDCDGLKEVTIGDGVTTIGNYAFYDCDALTTVTFGDSLETIGTQAFYSCNNLQEVVLGGNIATVGSLAFYQCTKLATFVAGDSVTSIGQRAFYGCTALNNVILGNGLTTIDSEVFNGCSNLKTITIPDSVTTIKSSAFSSCSKLESVTFGSGIEVIDNSAFRYCDAIHTLNGCYTTSDGRAFIKNDKLELYAKASGTEYIIPDGVTTIGSYAFYKANLTTVTIPESVTKIEDYALAYCSNLKKVYCNSLTPPTILNNAFYDNASGRRFYVYDEAVNSYKKLWSSYSSSIYGNGGYSGSELTTIYYTSTDGNIVNSDYLSIKENTYVDGQGKMVVCGKLETLPEKAFFGCKNLKSVTIPDSVAIIGDSAFNACYDLNEITIPDNVTEIGDSAFFECWKLARVTMGNSVISIGDRAFYSCSIEDVVLPNGLQTIGDRAFWKCDLTSITIPNSVEEVGVQAFECWSLKEFNGKFASEDGRCLIIDETIIAYASASGDEYLVPENVTKIGAYTFAESSLNSITLHENVNEIKEYAFNSWSLLRVYVMSEEPAYLNGSGFFASNYDLKIYVPKESENRYKFDYYWDDYAAFIYPYDYERVQKNNEIWYTPVDNAIVEPYNRNAFGYANIVSNSYQDGRYIITFDREITEIGYDAFWDCDNLLSVIIPESVTVIGSYAFQDCNNLLSVIIPESVTVIGSSAFSGCGCLTDVTLGNCVETIGDDAFNGSGLRSITIPDSVTTIGDSAFSGCWYLSEFKGKYASEDSRCLIINGVLKSFASADINTYTIPNGVTEIGSSAFESTGLKNVTIPDSVVKIGRNAFAHCGLSEVIIGNNVSVIDEYGFWNCTSLKSVTMPNSVKSIGEAAFTACYNLQEFKGELAKDNGRILVIDDALIAFAPSGLTEYAIPNFVTSVSDYAFYSCGNLTSVTIPDSVTSIGNSAFVFCSKLTNITIPDSVTTIGSSAFSSCKNLTSITIPESITSIGGSAFYGCSNLTSVYCKPATPPSAGYDMLHHHYNDNYQPIGCTIYVPMESIEAYKTAANWSRYAVDIVGYAF